MTYTCACTCQITTMMILGKRVGGDSAEIFLSRLRWPRRASPPPGPGPGGPQKTGGGAHRRKKGPPNVPLCQWPQALDARVVNASRIKYWRPLKIHALCDEA